MTGQQTLLLAGPNSTVISVDGSPDGKRLASASWEGTAKIWDLANQDVVTISVPPSATTMTSIAFSPDGKTVFTGSDEKFVRQ